MFCEKNKCTGCFACYNICPKNAIQMIEDDNGFIYPKIDSEKCIKCGLCRKICPAINEVELKEPLQCFAMQAKNSEILGNSTSGGAAAVFSRFIIKNGGIVYGATFEQNFKIQHVRIDSLDQLEKIKGSKYVHCYINNTYSMIKKDLQSDKKVLFTGTPCQVAGLKKYLMKEFENLYCIDIICHGVPSQMYLKEELSKYLDIDDITSLKFRSEDEFKIIAMHDGKKVLEKDKTESMYYDGFMDGFFYRENCYSCKYANSKRISDITIGDFWGIGKDSKFYKNKNKGLSVLLPITTKGLYLIEKCKNEMELEERNIEEAVLGNSQLQKPTKMDKNYYKFKKKVAKSSFKKAYRKYKGLAFLKKNLKQKLKNNKLIYKIYSSIKRCSKK